jgi:mannose-6-phosphate isomerase-like protein (cupin superfamily)
MAEYSRKVKRPWGHYREYARNQPCTVWLVEMNPGESGSLQSHEHFDELWTMLDEGAEVQVGDLVFQPDAFEEVFIPRGTKHRFSNAHGTRPIRMFEVAYGPVSDEDKVRYDDKYGRAGAKGGKGRGKSDHRTPKPKNSGRKPTGNRRPVATPA